MATRTQKYYLLTEITLDTPVDTQAVDSTMQELKADGKMVFQYNGGKCPGVNLEQKMRIPDHIAPKVRSLLGIGEKKL